MKTIINSVGTSLLGNFHRSRQEDPTLDALVRFANEVGPTVASAELNALDRMKVEKRDRLVFLHSDTPEGEMCALALARYCQNKLDVEAIALRIAQLEYSTEKFKKRGLRVFANALIQQVDQARKLGDVAINATGGFKAQIAFATAVGLILQVPVYYIHEQFDALIEMPMLPIGWDYASLVHIEPVLDRVNEGIEAAELERMLQSYDPATRDQVMRLLDDDEEFVVFSDIGQALYSGYKTQAHRVSEPIWLTQDSAKALDKIRNTSSEARIAMLIERLGNPTFRSGCEQKKNSDCLFFPKGHCAERVGFFVDEEGRVVVVAAFTSHKDYEDRVDSRELQRRFFKAELEYQG